MKRIKVLLTVEATLLVHDRDRSSEDWTIKKEAAYQISFDNACEYEVKEAVVLAERELIQKETERGES